MTPNRKRLWRALLRNPRIWFGFSILTIVFSGAIFAPLLTQYTADDMDISLRLTGPSIEHWLGCDVNGGDVWTAVLYGARLSLFISFLTVFISVTVGTAVGLISGFRLGITDTIFMRLVDIIMAVPGILVAMILSSLLGASVLNVVFAISATGWTSAARLVRGQVLSIREREFVTAARAIGATDISLMLKHILPQTITPLVVHSTFSLSGVIIVEASLSFLGLGAQGDYPTWGGLLGQGRAVLSEAPHLSIVPGMAIMLVVLALNFIGDAMRDILDPKR
jgi:peptide/nickel transport system permease protein